MKLPISVYSDYVCPYCFLAQGPLAAATRGRDVRVEWMPFELRPEPQPTLRPEGEYLQSTWNRSVYPLAERMGVPIVLPSASPQPRSRLAFEGYQYARERKLGAEYNHRVFAGFFQEGRDIGDPVVLVDLAADVGLDRVDFGRALAEGRFAEAHRWALRHAVQEFGIDSVPTIVIGDRVVPGLRSADDLAAIIDREIARRRPPA